MQAEFSDYFLLALRVKAYLCCFTQFTVDQSKLTMNGSVLSDTPNVRYLVALYYQSQWIVGRYAHLLLQFYIDSFETSQVFWTWSEDMHVVWI